MIIFSFAERKTIHVKSSKLKGTGMELSFRFSGVSAWLLLLLTVLPPEFVIPSILIQQRGSLWDCYPSDKCTCLTKRLSVDRISVSCGDFSNVQRENSNVFSDLNAKSLDALHLINSSRHFSNSTDYDGLHNTTTVRTQLYRTGLNGIDPAESGDGLPESTVETGTERITDFDYIRYEKDKRDQRMRPEVVSDKSGPLPAIDQNFQSLEATELESRSNSFVTTDGEEFEQFTEGPSVDHCQTQATVELTLVGDDMIVTVPTCSIVFRRVSFLRNTVSSIDNRTFENFREFHIERLDFLHGSVSVIRGDVFDQFVGSLDSLNLSNNRIDQVEENSISQASLLRVLDISSNQINNTTSLVSELRLLPNLTVLNLSRNAIETVSFSSNRISAKRHDRNESFDHLEFPDKNDDSAITANMFQTGFVNLEVLDLSGNKITNLDAYSFVDLMSIQELNLSHNAIRDVDSNAFVSSKIYQTGDPSTLQNRNHLEQDTQEYYISSALCNRGWPNLRSLDLSHNNLSDLSAGALSGALCTVRHLLLAHNHIAHLPPYMIERLPYLEHIDLGHNELTWLDVGSFTNPSLKYINLEYNRLRKIISMTFLYLPAITSIDLGHNDIIYLYKFAFYRLCSEGQSVAISLRSNHLQTDGVWKLMSTFQHLGITTCSVHIDLSDNNVTRFLGDALDFIQGRLNASDALHFRHWIQVSIELTGNPIQCDCSLVEDVRTMTTIYGRIIAVETTTSTSVVDQHSNLESWKQLDCSNNVLTDHGANILPATVGRFLRESGCQPRSCFPLCSCSFDSDEFIHMNCSHLNLTSLPSTWPLSIRNRDDLQRIRSIDLTGNNLTEIGVEFLRKMPHLQEIRLLNNAFTSVPPGLLTLSSLRCLTLDGNSLLCNSSDDYFRRLIKRDSDAINVITCSGSGNRRQDTDRLETLIQRCVIEKNASDAVSSKLLVPSRLQLIVWSSIFSFSLTISLLILAKYLISKRRRIGRKLVKRITSQNLLKVSTMDPDSVQRELFILCSTTDCDWVREKVITEITRELSGVDITIIFRTIQPSVNPGSGQSLIGSDCLKTSNKLDVALVFLSKDCVDAAKNQETSDIVLSEIRDFLSMRSTVFIVLTKEVNFADMNPELRRTIQQHPCLNITDRSFVKSLLRRITHSFHLDTQTTKRLRTDFGASLKQFGETKYESILNKQEKY